MRRGILLVIAVLAWASILPAQSTPSLEPRTAVGRNASPASMLLARTGGERPWTYVETEAEVFSRDRLLALPGTRAEILSPGGNVALTLVGNLPQLSTFAGFQSEVILHESRSYHLDLTLNCGRIVLTNHRPGVSKVWVRLPTLVEGRPRSPEMGFCEFLFANAGDSVALEIHGRWPRGVPFTRVARANTTPTALFNVLVLKGSVQMKTASHQYTLSAPPGPASLSWDSESGPGGPQKLDKLPDWVTETSDGNKNIAEVAKRYATAREGRGPVSALLELIAMSEKDDDALRAELCRRFAVLCLGSLDELPRVAGAIELGRWPEVRDVAIVALRHHLGERPGRDQALFQMLQDTLSYPEGSAEAVLQLLRSPFDPEQPETYSALLAYLRHPRTAVRELARWHLERYVPEGKALGFDATADEAARDKAIQGWKKLLEERPKK